MLPAGRPPLAEQAAKHAAEVARASWGPPVSAQDYNELPPGQGHGWLPAWRRHSPG